MADNQEIQPSMDSSKRSIQQDSSNHSLKRPRIASQAPIRLFCTDSDLADGSISLRSHCWTLREMLDIDNNSFDWAVIGNYMLDTEFLLSEIPELASMVRVLFYGIAETSLEPWQQVHGADIICLDPSAPPGSTNPTGIRIPYGVHHSKFFLLGNAQYLRVVIHTANLRYSDIHLKAQAAYMQDFPVKVERTTSRFERDLVAYLQTYKYKELREWDRGSTPRSLVDQIHRYDFSAASVVLLSSTPGYHSLEAPRQKGHLGLKSAVAEFASKNTTTSNIIQPVVCQFSSIGSLTEKYLQEIVRSMDTGLASRSSQDLVSLPQKLRLIYPTVQEIRESVEGYRGGGSVPGTLRNVSKPFLRPLFCKWAGSTRHPLFKPRNVPHIKSYFQLKDDGSLAWLAITSHNLSKAAWGDVVNSSRHREKRLFTRHWELGVFVVPQLLRVDSLVPSSAESDFSQNVATIPLPYSVTPELYQAEDEPWAVDKDYVLPDRFGRLGLH